jgi:serine phosphatase RsbU (regulator of sigma subunit)
MSEDSQKKLSIPLLIGIIFLVIVAVNYISGIVSAVTSQNWPALFSKLVTLIVLAVIAFIYRDTLKQGMEALKKRREIARRDFEDSKGDIGIKDAAIFSLTWSREIYKTIPEDRKKLVKTSFILIGIAMGVVLMQMDSYSLLTILTVCALVLAGVNLLIWGVGRERIEKDRIKIELETARKMQMSLMPKQDPAVSGFDISGCCMPAHDVGGDLFDFVWSDKEQSKLCITVVDVSGKGMDAALTAVYTSGALVSEAQHQEDVATVIKNLNTAIYSRRNRGRFVSMLMAALDVASRKIRFVKAGQTRPLLLRENHVSVLTSPGPRFPLGVMESPIYLAEDIQLYPGDTLLLCTDGVTEAMNTREEMYGDERLRTLFLELVRKYSTAADIVNAVRREIMNFAGSAQQHDDVTIVVVKSV